MCHRYVLFFIFNCYLFFLYFAFHFTSFYIFLPGLSILTQKHLFLFFCSTETFFSCFFFYQDLFLSFFFYYFSKTFSLSFPLTVFLNRVPRGLAEMIIPKPLVHRAVTCSFWKHRHCFPFPPLFPRLIYDALFSLQVFSLLVHVRSQSYSVFLGETVSILVSSGRLPVSVSQYFHTCILFTFLKVIISFISLHNIFIPVFYLRS